MMKICEHSGRIREMMAWESKCYECMKQEALEKTQKAI